MTEQPAPPVALYIHIPFCVSLCPYCDFVVYAGAASRGPRSKVDLFLSALHAELDVRADALDQAFPGRPPLESVYLGGGTPSLLPAAEVAAILDQVRTRFGVTDSTEVTLEANPGPDERGDGRGLREAGVTRLSLGAQSMSSVGLRRLGRRHRVADVGAAVTAARDGGIESISLDLLYDAPDSSLADWIDTLDAALELRPDHLSLYALTLDDPDAEGLTGPGGDHLPTTRGARRWRATARLAQDEDRAAAQYHHAVHRLAGRAGAGTRSATGPGPATRVGTTRSTGNAGRTRPWDLERTPSMASPDAGMLRGSMPMWPRWYRRMEDRRARRPAPRRRSIRRVQPQRRSSSGSGPTAACRSRQPISRHSWMPSGGRLAAELVVVTDDDRVVLTTRGRLLSNELFSRLV